MSEKFKNTIKVKFNQILLNKVKDIYWLWTLKMKDNWKMNYAWSFNNFYEQLKINIKTLYYQRINESEYVLMFENEYQIFLKRVKKKLNVNVDVQQESKNNYNNNNNNNNKFIHFCDIN